MGENSFSEWVIYTRNAPETMLPPFPSQKEEKQNHDPSTAMIDTTMGKEQTVRTVWDPP